VQSSSEAPTWKHLLATTQADSDEEAGGGGAGKVTTYCGERLLICRGDLFGLQMTSVGSTLILAGRREACCAMIEFHSSGSEAADYALLVGAPCCGGAHF